ncbi:response regulator [Pseudodesulfovibrio pelocollis]|uniref:response regulator n=1 Tax=Pseudodesulfovibrio pelocollis TaxID=3051432 RepID=UPI00255ACC4D|nr:response regulator [Pseudodesulfovibrio sp. SB368]
MAKILLVEDNADNRLLVKDILSHKGHDILEAPDGMTGIRMAEENMPDLVLIDIQMPVLDGEKALGLLKSNPRTKHLQIIAVTSFAMKGDQERLLKMGFAGYIAKPINTREFPSQIEDFLSRKT